jgi:DNA-binding XRE family transcriptional regulator
MKNRIEELIKELGITPYRFAKDTGISSNTVYQLKNNPDQFPSGVVFDRIISHYQVGVDRIVYWEEPKKDG